MKMLNESMGSDNACRSGLDEALNYLWEWGWRIEAAERKAQEANS